ncbi:Modification methylase RsrI [Planctomycetes bacterium Poly30]|uniref:site-specific DNA-methyltransferase (adenine-specific) n=1 Tax=Saltatorellus ferox TaxID=2528018 RepID=A0A518F123_9BACT|nr:Modification methylase RsrI [Planctomycetes bacterium Poly30]
MDFIGLRAHTRAVPPKLDIHFGENLDVLARFKRARFDLIYIDPPFNTGKRQARLERKTRRAKDGDHKGFYGERYRTVTIGSKSFADQFDDYMAFLEPRIEEAHRLLKPTGSFLLHLDYREVHYAKVLTDAIFGRKSFQNEIVWAYDYGARSKKRWPAKHDNILWYAKDPANFTFRYDHVDRIPYLAPKLVTKEKAIRGKTPTDTWWHTIVSPNGKEKTGYPTQKPLGIIDRIINVHTEPGDKVLDFFAGSGTIGESAIRQGRSAVLVDQNEEAMQVMASRLAFARPKFHGWTPPAKPGGRALKKARKKARKKAL